MFKGGMDEAIAMLKILSVSEAKKLIENIRSKDPMMADLLSEGMIQLEDLRFCSAPQLVGLLRDIDLEMFGLALRTTDKEVVDKILSMVSTGIKLDIEDGLKGKPRKVSEVEEAQTKVIEIIQKKVNDGTLVLSKEGDEYV
jgi:flagellar motor switch protein FliG